jgi:hypothetical protein
VQFDPLASASDQYRTGRLGQTPASHVAETEGAEVALPVPLDDQ